MNHIKELLKERQKKLYMIKRQKEKALSKVPEGTLHICNQKHRILYYHRTDPKDTNGTYIPKKQFQHILRLLTACFLCLYLFSLGRSGIPSEIFIFSMNSYLSQIDILCYNQME